MIFRPKGVVYLLLLILTSCTTPPMPANEKINIKENKIEQTIYQQDYEIITNETIIDDQKLNENKIKNDIVELWTLIFNDSRALEEDPRRQLFPTYAEYLYTAINMYQKTNDTNGRLPKERSTYLLLAYMMFKESSLISDAIGKMGEVGLLQIHGVALNGYKTEEIRQNPSLGILLGVRWFTLMMSECPESRQKISSGTWTWEDWYQPISAYAGGINAIDKNGNCLTFSLAKNRINKLKFYQTRIDS